MVSYCISTYYLMSTNIHVFLLSPCYLRFLFSFTFLLSACKGNSTITNVAAAQSFRGCTVIDGYLDISVTGGGNLNNACKITLSFFSIWDYFNLILYLFLYLLFLLFLLIFVFYSSQHYHRAWGKFTTSSHYYWIP